MLGYANETKNTLEKCIIVGVQPSYGKGPHPLLRVGSLTALGKQTYAYSTKQSPSWEANSSSDIQDFSPHFMEN